LRHLEEEVSLQTPPARTAASISLFSPPPAPPTVNAGFVELAVDRHDDSVPTLLTGLGFHPVGRHRRKEVTWWRNGHSHVLLNAEDETLADLAWDRPHPWVTSIGLEADPIDAVATRAAALRWPLLARSRDAAEAALPGVRTASDVEVFLSGTEQSGQCWRDDFVAAPGYRAADGSPAHLGNWLGLDHVAITVGRDAFAAEVSFFRTVLGMSPGPITEVIEPNGRLKTRVLEPPAGGLRVVLNDPHGVGRRRRPGITQVSFSCVDLLGQVRRIRDAGVELLSIPENYYDDLRARLPLDEDFVRRLADSDVLYDETPDGSFLHVFTTVIAGRFCVELVERIGNYTGFGATDTHVRLVAQAARLAAQTAKASAEAAARSSRLAGRASSATLGEGDAARGAQTV
jgi:4-hydroxyphenylpyruvate dioxygenase